MVVAHSELGAEAEEGDRFGRETDKLSRGTIQELVER
jgi:hypothetical protein